MRRNRIVQVVIVIFVIVIHDSEKSILGPLGTYLSCALFHTLFLFLNTLNTTFNAVFFQYFVSKKLKFGKTGGFFLLLFFKFGPYIHHGSLASRGKRINKTIVWNGIFNILRKILQIILCCDKPEAWDIIKGWSNFVGVFFLKSLQTSCCISMGSSWFKTTWFAYAPIASFILCFLYTTINVAFR